MSRIRLRGQSMGLGGRIIGTLFLLIFLGVGVLFCGLVGREIYRAALTYSWTKTACVILESGVVEHPSPNDSPYEFAVRYRYVWQGQEHTSTNYALQARAYSEYDQAQRWAVEFPSGSQTTCYVNPQAPAEAVLKRSDLWIGLVMLLPLVFVAVGGFGIYSLWRGVVRQKTDAATLSAPISSRDDRRRGQGRGWLLLFGSVFLLAGGTAFYFLALKPVWKMLEARNWNPTPCTVISSRVQRHSGDDGPTYRVDILYTYTLNDQEYKSSRYGFLGGSSSGYQGKADIVNRHPPGKQTLCYVNPKNPHEAVLERGFTPDLWFGLIPLVFVGVGVGAMVLAIRLGRKPAISSAVFQPALATGLARQASGAAALANHGPVTLRPQWSRLTQFLVSIGIATFWNGIVSVFLWQIISGWRRGHPEWFLTLFMIPFVLVGLGLIGFVGYSFLRMFNPSVILTVNNTAVPLGGTLQAAWNISGRAHVINRLRLYLEGREEATYRRGTRSHTDKLVFATHELVSLTPPQDLRTGQTHLRIPTDTMPSFTSAHNRIAWTLFVVGEIERWPDIKDEYAINLLPLAPNQTQSL